MIRNKINKKCYIGQTIELDVNTRWKRHIRSINTDRCPALYGAFRKHGLENFEFKIICICFDEACDDLEISYISKYNSIVPNGYNLETGGNKNKIIHPETCEKISRALTGKKHSEERRLKNSNGQKGKHIWSDERRQLMSIQRKGKKFNLTDEQRLKRSERLKGHPVSDLTRQKVAEANRNKVWTDEMRQKISKKVSKFTLDNILIASYISIQQASEQCSVSRNGISNCCNNKINKYKGFIWKFI